MIVLAIDTCDSRGSVAVLRDADVLHVAAHESAEEYSIWLLPTVATALGRAGVEMADVDGYAVAAGPGSFTGVRIGLTTVKAWSEVFGKRIAAVSRLEAIAVEVPGGKSFVAAFADGQRGQVFGAVYRSLGSRLERLSQEMVIPPEGFVQTAVELAGGDRISWVSTDVKCILGDPAWTAREALGETIAAVPCVLAPSIGRIGMAQFAAGKFTDALSLDANYVRRSDATVYWKDRDADGR